jgi:hypothetical protein
MENSKRSEKNAQREEVQFGLRSEVMNIDYLLLSRWAVRIHDLERLREEVIDS